MTERLDGSTPPEPANEDRAAWAYTALKAHPADPKGDDMRARIGDLLANLAHLCRAEELDPLAVFAGALENFAEEEDEEREAEMDGYTDAPEDIDEGDK